MRRAFNGGYKLIDQTLAREFDPSFASEDWASRGSDATVNQLEKTAVAL
jgi:hypothetical protein